MDSIKNREVFYIAGYDPRGYRYYYSLYKRNAKKQNKINNLNIKLSKTKKINENISSCEITTDEDTKTTYNFFSWNDIVKENWEEGFIKNLIDTLYFIKMYMFTGIYTKVAKVSPRQIIAGSYPLFYLSITIFITLYFSFFTYEILNEYVNNLFSILISMGLFFIGIKAIEKIGDKIAVFWLSRIYAFCARFSEKKIKNMDERIEYFSEYIFNKIKDNNDDKKEFILSAHSVGTILAISISSKVIRKCIEEKIDYSNFKLLTLGNCLPLVCYQKKFYEFKEDLKLLGKTKNFIWLDYTATIDGACFPLVDPITSSGIKREENCGPVLMSARFFKLFKEENYKKIKKEKYKAHFLYLTATDLIGNYDYFDITAGNKALEYRIKNYTKEK
jgi:hypothetical protein